MGWSGSRRKVRLKNPPRHMKMLGSGIALCCLETIGAWLLCFSTGPAVQGTSCFFHEPPWIDTDANFRQRSFFDGYALCRTQ
jgi:hypothetical protein